MQLNSIARCTFPLVGLLLAGQASAQTYNATFDSLSEGALGTTLVEGGLTFSDLDRYLGGSNEVFTVEDASSDLGVFPGFTSPNALGFGGWSSGGAAAYSRCGNFKITPPATSNQAQLELFVAGGSSAGNLVTLEARLAGVLVASDAITIPSGFGPHARTLTISAADFDTLNLVGSGSQNQGSFFALVDTVVVGSADSGTPYCFGDGSGMTCPCGNLGTPGVGCTNSGGLGGQVLSSGSASVAADDLLFHGSQLPTNKPALCFSGAAPANGGLGNFFGDGLLCAGGAIQRHTVNFTDANGEANWGPGFASSNGWTSGVTRYFQIWYRDPVGPCGSQFNTTNAIQVDFTL